MPTPEEIRELIARYEANRAEYLRADGVYTELDVRAEFIDPLFELLGWDLTNRSGKANRLREVIRETRVDVDENTKRPDYEFRLGAERKFFVEAKKPRVNLITDPKSAFQVRRYGWSGGLMISVLTNFEDLIIYDTTVEPREADTPENSRFLRFHYTEYADRFDEIASLLSKEAVYSGTFDERFLATTASRPAEKIDSVFLRQLNAWRLDIANDLYAADNNISEVYLNEITQRLILRVLFLRMCEDRGIQTYEHLKTIAVTNSWDDFTTFLVECDQRYDSGLFDTSEDPFISGQGLQVTPGLILRIIESLYYPTAPYTFSVIEPEFLGSIYEQFLTERISVVEGHTELIKKPEHQDRDIVSTPRPIIEKIVQATFSPALEGASSEDILTKRVLDPAVGSGGFLISAFDYFSDLLARTYLREGANALIYETANGYQLTFEEKANLLSRCFFGVDRDYLAVEVAQFSLLAKLLENETAASLPDRQAILPSLERNIVFGDSLIDERIFDDNPEPNTIGIPLTWGEQIPEQYDFIIGNPPYLKTEDMINLEPVEHRFYTRYYRTAFKQFDKYFLFLERILEDLLSENGRLGMIVSRKFSNIESGKKIRRLISNSDYSIQLIDFGNAQLFGGRITYTCLLFLFPVDDPEAEELVPYELITSPKQWIQSQVIDTPSMELPRSLISGEQAWVLPNTPAELQLLEALIVDTVPLGEIMHVFNGIQTSRNSVYVINEWEDIDDQYISFTNDGEEWTIEKSILKPFFEDERGKPLKSFYPLPKIVKIIFPYTLEEQDGILRSRIIPPDELAENYPRVWNYLNHYRDSLRQRDIRPANFPADEWYRYGRHQGLTLFENRLKIVVGVNSQGDKYVYDDTNTLLAPGGTAGEVAVAHFINEDERSRYDLYFVLAILNHKAIEYFCRKRGSPFQHGWYSRGTAVLDEVPVPLIDFDTDNPRRRIYEEIVDISRSLCQDIPRSDQIGGSQGVRIKQTLTQRRLHMERLISRLYDIEAIINLVNLPE